MRKLSLILLALTLGVIILNAREVSGTVSSNTGKSLAGVIVTDGVNFTKTAAEGSFSFNISDDAEFVYIVSPSNYQPPIDSGAPVFYADADNGQTEFKFVLTELPKSNDYNIVAIADPQTMTDKQFKMMKGKPMRDLVKTFKALKGHTVGIALGDITWNNMELLPKYTDQFKRTGAAFYPVIGNHDYAIEAKGDHIASQTYRDVFGPENYAFYLGEDFVIVVDNIVYDTNK